MQNFGFLGAIIIVSVIILLSGSYFYVRNRNKYILLRLLQLEENVKFVIPICVAFRAELLDKATYDLAPEMNGLLSKLSFGELTDEEREKLLFILEEYVNQRAAAELLPDFMGVKKP